MHAAMDHVGPNCQPLHVRPSSDVVFVHNVDHAVLRTPARWTMARPRKGMTRRRRSHSSGGKWVSRGMARPTVGVEGAVRHAQQHSQPREAGAGGLAGAGFGGWSKKIRD